MTVKIGAVTGPNTSAVQYGVGGTDLGIARRLPNGRQAVVLGDTFDQMSVGGPGWRSPVILLTDEQSPAAYANGLTFHGAVGGSYARQLWPYNHDRAPWTNGGFSTVLPSDLLVIGSRIYLFVTVCRSLSEVLWTEIQYSDDNGQSWVHAGPAGQRPWHHEGAFQMGITWELGPDGWVYIMGNKWLVDGGSNVHLYRCRPHEVADRSTWSGWGWNGTDWGWNRACSDIFPAGTKVREMNLRVVQGQWLLTYTQTAPDIRVDVKGLRNGPTSHIGNAPTTTVVRHVAHDIEHQDRNNTLAQCYGGYVLEGSTLDELYVLVSQWDTRDDWPYQINLYRHTVHADIPRPEPPAPDPTLEELVDENYLLSRAILATVSGNTADLPTAPAAETFDVATDTNTALWRLARAVGANTGGI
ncbi:DUF4185 domain-containing protein [Rhodococcus sp. CH91]|uniref:DUF4185 domain-containing protein n=1 Tax=Rhodococcus sp. CH91 TaxID=2910256 RepID=UPI001F4AEF48|nr:DUF4185 domain-containing protein [Rhodococcus sp. CH91]